MRALNIMGQNFSLLEYGNCRDLTHAPMSPMSMQCFIHVHLLFFLIRTNLIRTLRLKSLEKEEQFKNNLRLKFFSTNFVSPSL